MWHDNTHTNISYNRFPLFIISFLLTCSAASSFSLLPLPPPRPPPLSLSRARTRTHASSARPFLCLVTPCSFSSSIFLRLLNFSTDSAAAEYLLAFFSISSALNFLPGHCQCQCQCISPLFHLHTARLSASDRKLQFTVFDCIQIMWNGWK